MNERKFLRAINCKDNINGEFTYSAVYQFLDEANSITIPRKIDILKNFLRINNNTKLPAEIIDENFLDLRRDLDIQLQEAQKTP